MAMLTLLNEPRLLPVPGFVLHDGIFVCGRATKSELVVPHETVSRQHAELQVTGSLVKVVDLKSRNGTFIDGERIESAELRPMQLLSLGEVSFVLLEGDRTLDDWESDEAASTRRAVGPHPAESDTVLLQLSEAQHRVLDLALTGLVEKQIARRLNISRHTAHNHLRAIYRILDVHSRGELLAQLLPKKK